MTRLQVVQYLGAALTVLASVLTDPAVLAFFASHPGTVAGLLSAPSLVTLARAALRAWQAYRLRRRPALPPETAAPEPVADEDTAPL